ncbi:MAG: PHP domain-containing protein, partial [Clostridia bacterium]
MYKQDLHIHTYFSFDATPTFEEYAIKAIEDNVSVLCFTDHIECTEIYNTFATFDWARRREEFETVRAKYGKQVKLLLGVEFGEPHYHPKEYNFVLAQDFDMIIGSVHYPADVIVSGKSLNESISDATYRITKEMVTEGGFDVLGHLDFPKRFVQGFVEDIDKSNEVFQLCVKHNIVPEVNTASVARSGLPETMPPIRIMPLYADAGGKYVTINSDSHATNT